MKSRTLLVLSAGPLQLPAILTGKRLGLRVIALDGNPAAVGLAQADRAMAVDIRDPVKVLTALEGEQIDGAVTICTEMTLRSLAAVNEAYDLHGPRTPQIDCISDKSQMRRCFEQAEAPSPQSISCTSLEEVLRAYQILGGRVILKPAAGMGSRGIFDLDSVEAIPAAVVRSLTCSLNGKVVLEEFVDGPEFSVETLTWGGHTEVVAITEKLTSGSPYWVEMGHAQPPQLSPEERDAITKAAVAGIQALGLDWSASHTEVKLSSRGARLIEVGGRLGGDFITTHLTPLSTGIDIVEGAIRVALGEAPTLNYREVPRGSAIRYLAPEPGLLRQDLDLDPARNCPGVVEVGCSFHAGQHIPPVRSSTDRTAWVIAEGENREKAIQACEAGISMIQPVTT
jgi:biotin carboxylase